MSRPGHKRKSWRKRLRKALTFERVAYVLSVVVPVIVALIESRSGGEE